MSISEIGGRLPPLKLAKAVPRSATMTEKELFSKASDVSSQDGKVLVDGPDGVDVALTPEAAEETGDRLVEHAMHAAGQRRIKRIDGEREKPNE
jgi:hypothetical protein